MTRNYKGQVAIERTSFSACNLRGQVAISLNDNSFKASHLKGQVATEFFAYATIFLLIVIITAASVFTFQDTETAYYENRYMVEVGHRFASGFNLAVSAGKGFTYNMTFPKTIFGTEYNVTFIENKSIVIEWNSPHGEMVYPYPISPFSIEFTGCMEIPEEMNDSTINAQILLSTKGNGLLEFKNNGEKILINPKGCEENEN